MTTILEQLKDISQAVMYAVEARELEVVLQRIADAARDLVKTKYAALGIPDGQGGLNFFMTSGLTPEQEARIPHRPKGYGLIGAIMREKRVIRLENMGDDPRSYGFPDNHPYMGSFLGAPVMVANHLYGMLYLSDKIDGLPFTLEDEILVETLAGYAAFAIAGAELSQKESRLRLLEERERIGMELHDGVIQSLYGIGMQVDMLRLSGVIVEQEHLSEIVGQLNNAIEEIRRFIGDLRSKQNKMTVRDYFEYLKSNLHPSKSINININAPDTYAPFSPAVFESVALIANEAMSNAIRHADATDINIEIKEANGKFIISVSDNGKGFDTDLLHSSVGLGLSNMQKRASLYGGTVRIVSQDSVGTEVKIVIPLGTH